MGFEDFMDLGQTGHVSKESVKPEDEFFHTVYPSGQTRKNHINISEHAGKLQIRGVEYNLDTVYMIITHVKQTLQKVHRENSGRETTQCFSYQEGSPPWKGTEGGHACGVNSAERAADPHCNGCKAQLLVAGVLCAENGKPILTEENKPTFVFIRGKGMKYSNIAEYLNEMSRKEIDPIFNPPTDESTAFEKAVVNNKRFVTKISIGSANSQYGPKQVFDLEPINQLPTKVVMDILEMSKKTLDKFNEKFNWAKKAAASGFTPAAPKEEHKMPEMQNEPAAQEEADKPSSESVPTDDSFDFGDVKF